MKTNEIAKKGLYVGAGAGLVLFAIIGFLPGSFLGGTIGLNIAGSIFGTPVSSAILPRLIVGLSMLLGIFVSGVIFVVGASLLGWVAGYTIGTIRQGKEEVAAKAAKIK